MSSTTIAEPDAADLTKAESADSEAPEPAVLSEADLYLMGKPIAEALADGWHEDHEDHPAGFADRSIRLVHPDGRSIGIRHLWQGRAVQTFAVGGPAPEQTAGSDGAASENTRLPKGVRYSTGVRFTTASPLEEILTAIRTVLLPAFDGTRLRLRADGMPIPPAVQPPAEGAADSTDAPAAKAKAKPKGTARRSTSAKRTTRRRTPAAA
ncbi:hypothetical protein [Streptomyces sp. S.PB5]|uniref:hypothetical protein n=1 Tax=Streptomyces sp. S.PB5 TaxID=3020844 RepID=UPI0025AFD66E|nr:hypothetical protein [Streptomyces sp. S.PB5]MDN3025717.1 hypothetical protein [Streptomyces sp. S.PB5]